MRALQGAAGRWADGQPVMGLPQVDAWHAILHSLFPQAMVRQNPGESHAAESRSLQEEIYICVL